MDITRYLQIWSGVGAGTPNLVTDVGHIQLLLRLAASPTSPVQPIDGEAGPEVIKAISSFQQDRMKIAPDGRVEPSSQTFRALVDAAAAQIEVRTRFPAASHHGGHLTDADYAKAAASLGCRIEAIKAVSEVESGGAPFLPSGKPKILFEPHHFGKATDHKYDTTFPEVSRRAAPPRAHGVHGYGTNEEQWTRLRVAALLDRRAAIQCASWGRFQVLGSKWTDAGASSLEGFLSIMFTSERAQLDGFVAFVKHNHLAPALKRLDWRSFARGYNGRSYHLQHYDDKIARKYRELVSAGGVARR